MRRIDPQPDFAQRHVWHGVVIYDGSHRQWCWRDEVVSDRWEGLEGVEFAMTQRAPRNCRAQWVDGVMYWVDLPETYPHAHRLAVWLESWAS